MTILKSNKYHRWICIMMMTFLVSIASCVQVHAAIDEVESNNDKFSANKIEMGESVYGVTDPSSYGGYESTDWFKFSAPISGTAVIKLTADSYESEGPRIRKSVAKAIVKDGNGNNLAEVYDSPLTDSGASATFGVKSGNTYYVQCFGNYYGFYDEDIAYHFVVNYSIGKTTIKGISASKKSASIKWAKKSGATYYQIRYTPKSTYSSYSWRKAKMVKTSQNVNKKTIKGLKRHKKYYCQVRVVRKINGKTYYSGWSNRKAINTK